MRPTPDIGIGRRAAEEVLKRMGDTPAGKYMKSLGLKRGVIWEWQNGSAPAATSLQKLALAGYDVLYILTGERTAKEVVAIQEPRWIPVAKEMPPFDTNLQLFLGLDQVTGFCRSSDDGKTGVRWFVAIGNDFFEELDCVPTHWKLLGAPPREED